MSQNPQINIPTENQPFFNNGLPNGNTATTSDNSIPVLYGTTPTTSFVHVDSASQSYPTIPYNYNVVSTEQVSTQNLPQSATNISSLPPYMATPSEIIIFEIPGYDVIYIPKPNPFVNSNVNLSMQQQDSNFLNSSPLEQQNYVSSCVSGIPVGGSPIINTHDNQTMIISDNLLQNQQQNSQQFNNLHRY